MAEPLHKNLLTAVTEWLEGGLCEPGARCETNEMAAQALVDILAKHHYVIVYQPPVEIRRVWGCPYTSVVG